MTRAQVELKSERVYAPATHTLFPAAPATATHFKISVFLIAPWQCVQYFVCISK